MNKTNPGRLFEVDCVKSFAIIYMVCIHVYEQLSVFDHANVMPDSIFRITLEFLGGPLAAPVFMFCMGIGMIYTRHSTPADFCRRGIKLLLTGYALNFFRQTLLQLIGLMLGIDSGLDIAGGLLNGDILEFAGMSFLFTGLMKRVGIRPFTMCLIAVLIQMTGTLTSGLKVSSMVLECLIGLVLPGGKWVAFPLTLWFVYPVAGMVFAEQLRQREDRKGLYRKMLIASGTFFAAYTGILVYTGTDIRDFFALCNERYYNQTLLSTMWIVPVVIFAISASHFIFRRIEQTKAGDLIRYFSINLNRIYIIQWLLISYSVAAVTVTGWEKISSPPVIVLVSAAVIAAAAGINAVLTRTRLLH